MKMTWKLFTFSLFILTICLKTPFLLHEVLWTPKIQNLYILMVKGGGVLPHFQFSDVQSVLFKSLLLHLCDFALDFMMIYSCFYDEVVQYRLNPHGYCFDFVSDADWSISLPRIQNFQAEKILVSGRENFVFLTRINNIPAENKVHSSKEWSVFS